MRKYWIAPGLAALLGLLGGVLRYFQLANGFENGFAEGMAKRGAPETAALTVLTALALLAALAFAALLSRRFEAGEGFTRTFGMESFPLLLTTGIFAAAALMGAATFTMRRWGLVFRQEGVEMSLLVYLIFLVGTGISLLVMAISFFARREGPGLMLASVAPAIFYCYWLVVLYRDNLGNPVMMDYCFSCLAFAGTALSFYYMAGFAFGRRKTGCAVFFPLISIYFLCMAAADLPSRTLQGVADTPSYSASLWLVEAGTVGFLVISMMSMLRKLTVRNASGPEDAEPAPEPEKAETRPEKEDFDPESLFYGSGDDAGEKK